MGIAWWFVSKRNTAQHDEEIDVSHEAAVRPAPVKPAKPVKSRRVQVDSAFSVSGDEPDFFAEKQAAYNRAMEEYDDVPDLQTRDGKAMDVLEVLDIPVTYEIEPDVFLPDDIRNVTFDLQEPYGYEQSQVAFFVDRTRSTVDYYVGLLKARNEHVAKLATAIDKLQVDNHNLKYQREIDSGENIMPGASGDDFEGMYTEALLKIRRLEDELKSARSGGGIPDAERRRYEALEASMAALRREKDRLEEEVYHLRGRLAALEESVDEMNEGVLPDMFSPGEEVQLPDGIDNMIPAARPAKPAAPANSAFAAVDDPESDPFASPGPDDGPEILSDDPGFISDMGEYVSSGAGVDDNDELDALMSDFRMG